MLSRNADRRIAELLDDPMVQMLMRADRVDRRVLVDDLRRLACRIDRAADQVATSTWSEDDCCLALPAVAQSAAHIAAKAALAACGAYRA